jgi:DNA-directed RNA polymerase specialized sigma24 family protein
MSEYKRYNVRWKDGSYDPYRVPSVKRTYTDIAGATGELLDDEILTSTVHSDYEPPADEVNKPPMWAVTSNPDLIAGPDEPYSSAISEFEDVKAKQAFSELSPRQKKVWKLVMREGLTEEAAAIQLGITRQAVHGLVVRAKQAFENYLKDDNHNA